MNKQQVGAELEPVKCKNCAGTIWVEMVTFVKVPAVLSSNGKAGLAPAGQSFACGKCGMSIEETDAVKEMKGEKPSPIITK